MSKNRNPHFNRAAYDRWSNQYDLEPNSTVAADERFFAPLLERVRGQIVLEIGCGTGRHTRRLVEQENRVVAIDPSAGMLSIAKKKIVSDRVQFIHADYLEHPWAAGTFFDAAIACLVLEHIDDLDLFFQTTFDLLKNSGELFLSEIHPQRIAAGSQARFIDPRSNEEILLQSFAHREESLLKAALSAGFQCALNQDCIGDEAFADLHHGWEKYVGKPLIKILTFRKPHGDRP